MLARSIRRALLLSVLALVPAAAANAASLWAPLTSGTTAQITAIAAPVSGEAVFTTSAGTISYLTGSTFTQATMSPAAPLGLTAIGMSTNGTDGVAVGQAGEIYYSTDAGQQWKAATAPKEYESGSCSGGWSDFKTITDNLNSAKFVPSTTTVYITGDDNDVLRSANGGQTFTEVNKSASACVADSTGAFNDTAWLSSTVGYLISNQFGYLFRTTNGFGSATEVGGGSINGYNETTKLAVDLGNASDMWVAAGLGLSEGIDYSMDGGGTWNGVTGVNYNTNQTSTAEDIANNGTTVVAVGQDGDIWTSPDGVNFYQQAAAQPNNTINWDAVAIVPGTNTALVGGSGVNPASFVWSVPGQASQTGTTATFAFATAGSYTVTVSFKDLAGNAATASITINVATPAPPPPFGTTQHSTTTGGATVGLYGKVKVSGANARYIPVNLRTKKPRKFVIKLLTDSKKHKKTLATLTTTLRTGRKTVHLKIGKSVKSGNYEIQVRIYTTGKHGKAVGKRIKQVFVLD